MKIVVGNPDIFSALHFWDIRLYKFPFAYVVNCHKKLGRKYTGEQPEKKLKHLEQE